MKRTVLIIAIVAVLIIAGVATAMFLNRNDSSINADDTLTNTEADFTTNDNLNVDATNEEVDTNVTLDVNADLNGDTNAVIDDNTNAVNDTTNTSQ